MSFLDPNHIETRPSSSLVEFQTIFRDIKIKEKNTSPANNLQKYTFISFKYF